MKLTIKNINKLKDKIYQPYAEEWQLVRIAEYDTQYRFHFNNNRDQTLSCMITLERWPSGKPRTIYHQPKYVIELHECGIRQYELYHQDIRFINTFRVLLESVLEGKTPYQ
jgi:hypothetical protein